MIAIDELLKHFSTFLNIDKGKVTRLLDKKYHRDLRQYVNKHPQKHQDYNSLEKWALLFHKEFISGFDRIIQNYLQQYPEKQEFFSPLTYYQKYRLLLKQSPILLDDQSIDSFRTYLFAHLQEPCLEISRKKYHQYKEKGYSYEIADYFAWGVLCFPEIIVKFDTELSLNIPSYARYIISNRLIEEMRKVEKITGRTIWSLLLDTTERTFENILNNLGFVDKKTSKIRESYLLAWDCYKEIYQPAQKRVNRKIQEPSERQWQQILKAYNNNFDPNSHVQTDIQKLKKWLSECGKELLPTRVGSINERIGENQELEVVDTLTDKNNLTPETSIANQDLFVRFQKILETIYQNPTNYKANTKPLHPQIQQIVEMLLLEGRRQVEIAEEIFGVKRNDPVSRAMKNLKTVLAKELIKEYLHNSPSANDIENVCCVLNEYLKYYYECQYFNKTTNANQ